MIGMDGNEAEKDEDGLSEGSDADDDDGKVEIEIEVEVDPVICGAGHRAASAWPGIALRSLARERGGQASNAGSGAGNRAWKSRFGWLFRPVDASRSVSFGVRWIALATTTEC